MKAFRLTRFLASIWVVVFSTFLLTGCPSHTGTVNTVDGTPIPHATVFVADSNGVI